MGYDTLSIMNDNWMDYWKDNDIKDPATGYLEHGFKICIIILFDNISGSRTFYGETLLNHHPLDLTLQDFMVLEIGTANFI